MQATLKIRVNTTNYPLSIRLETYGNDKYTFYLNRKFKTKIDSFTLFNDFLMTDIEFRVKRNKVRNLEDFDFESVFTLEIDLCKNRLQEVYELQNEFLNLDEDSKDEVYKWIKKALSEFRKQVLTLK